MRRFGFSLLLSLLFLPPVAAQEAPVSIDRMVLTEKAAYALLPNELVAAPTVQQMSFSPDNRYLILVQHRMPLDENLINTVLTSPTSIPSSKITLLLWDSRAHRTFELWKSDTIGTVIQEINWLPKSDMALVLISETLPKDPNNPMNGVWVRQTVLRVNAGDSRAQPLLLPAPDIEDIKEIFIAPSRAMAVLKRTRFLEKKDMQTGQVTSVTPQYALYLLKGDGRLSGEFAIPAGVHLEEIVWSAEGTPVVNGLIPAKPGSGKKLTRSYLALDARTGTLLPLEKQPLLDTSAPLKPEPSANGLSVRLSQTTIKEEDGQTPAKENKALSFSMLWLESGFASEKPHLLVAGDASDGTLLSKQNTVVFRSHGAVFATPLLRIEKAQYLAMKRIADRQKLLVNAKHVGLSLLMFAMDNKEALPGKDGVNAKISPYLKNDSALNGFTYTYDGGPIADIENPAETAIGYIPGDGGRVVVYADGHVRWEANRQ